MKKRLDLNNPKTFNEKLQWLKLYYFPKNSTVIQCADKYSVRDYIKAKGLDYLLVPLLAVYDNPKIIDYHCLPKQFVLKCNHGCAYNIVCTDCDSLDKKATNKQLLKWLHEDFGSFNVEPHYSKIRQKKIICEEYLGENIIDYKFFCFNGVPRFLYVSSNLIHDRQAKIGFFNLDGSKMQLHRDDYEDIGDIKFPSFFEEIKRVATLLCEGFPFVRVDFFVLDNRFYFAELTFTPGACMMPFNPEEIDLEWGNLLDISCLKNE